MSGEGRRPRGASRPDGADSLRGQNNEVKHNPLDLLRSVLEESSDTLDQTSSLSKDSYKYPPTWRQVKGRWVPSRASGGAFAEAVERRPYRPVTRRRLVAGMFGAAFLAVVGRLAFLQGIRSGELSTEAAYERTAHVVLPHRRGTIYDRSGNVLATSVDATTIAVHPNQVADPNALANIMASVLGGSAESYAQTLYLDTTYAYIAKRVDPDVAERLRDAVNAENKERVDRGAEPIVGIEYTDVSRRIYPFGEIAGTIVGCVGEDGHGLTGLELQYEDVLGGTDGSLLEERGLFGAPIVGGDYERVDPVDGTDIVLSIDIDIQRIVQERLSATIEEWKAGDSCVMVTDPRTGEILACASTPYLDPSDLVNASADSFVSKCVSYSYEPGSTVKPLTASMAVDMGLATPQTEYFTPASIQVGDDWVHDADEREFDTIMTLTNILERSSNVGAVVCAEDVGADGFAEYFERYGIGVRTDVDFPGEEQGLVTRRENYTGAWAAMAFGQSIAVPPVQVARAIGAIANEGVLMRPHFLVARGSEQEPREPGERVISTATATQVAQMMFSVVENGYGSTGRVEGYRLAGKTGTSERVDPTTGLYFDDVFTASFVGFGPVEDPRALVYVLVDYVPNGGGTSVAGPLWADIMSAVLEKLQIPPQA